MRKQTNASFQNHWWCGVAVIWRIAAGTSGRNATIYCKCGDDVHWAKKLKSTTQKALILNQLKVYGEE